MGLGWGVSVMTSLNLHTCLMLRNMWGWEKKQVAFIPTRPPTTYVHTRLVDYIPVVMFTIYPPVMFFIYTPYAEKNKCLRFHAVQAIGNNACVRRVWDGPIAFFSVCNTSPPPSLQLAFCGMSPLTSHSVTRVL